MNADEAAKKFCSECATARTCRTPCTDVLLELWQEHDAKITIPQMEEQMQKARRRYLNEQKNHSKEIQ